MKATSARAGAKFERLLNQTAKNPSRLVKSLRGAPMGTIQQVMRRAPEELRNMLLGVPLFGRSHQRLIEPALALATKSLEDEMRWVLLSLIEDTKRLALHIAESTDVVRALVLGTYESANERLQVLETHAGISVWSISMRLLLAQYMAGLNCNRETLAAIRAAVNSVSIRAIVEFASQRAEVSASYSSFLGDLQRALMPLKDNGSAVVGWWAFMAAPFLPRAPDRDFEIMWYCGLLPAIDRYIAVLHILQTTSPRQLRQLLGGKCHQLLRKLADGVVDVDPTLTWMLLAHDTDVQLSSRPPAFGLNGLVEMYTRGHYDELLAATRVHFTQRPDSFELYELVANALVLGRHQNTCLLPSSSLAHELLEAVLHVVKRENVNSALEKLMRLGAALNGHRFGAQIIGFASTVPGSQAPSELRRLTSFCCTELTPRFGNVLDSQPKVRLLEQLAETMGGSATLRLYGAFASPLDYSLLHEVPEYRRLKYQAKAFQAANRLAEALSAYQQLESAHCESATLQESIYAGIFEIALLQEDYHLAAKAVVDAYLRNPVFLAAMNIAEFSARLKAESSAPAASILWPLFWVAVDRLSPESHNRQLIANALEDYMMDIGVSLPSQLSPAIVGNLDAKYLAPILLHASTIAVLDYLPDIERVELLEEERIKVLEALMTLSPDEAPSCKVEISLHSRNAAIRRLISAIDHSKIHIDAEGIVDVLGAPFEARYARFRAYAELSENVRSLSLAVKQGEPDPSDSEREIYEKIKILARNGAYYDSAYTQCWELFAEITSKVISGNEYGLDSYLSTRIRHGVLAGQLRSPFAADGLITQRTPQAGYARNERWENWVAEHVDGDLAEVVERKLRDFSRDVDGVIEAFRRERMQIKTHAGEKGLFDYIYTLEDHGRLVWKSSIGCETYEDYLAAMFGILIERTGQNLKTIAAYVRGELKNQLRHLLDVLTQDLYDLSPILTHGELGNAIRQCGVMLQTNIEVTASWFAPKAEHGGTTIDLEMLSSAVIDAVRKMYPAYEIGISNETVAGLLVGSGLLPSLWDVLLILLDNCVRHSKTPSIRGQLRFERNERYISLEVRNRVRVEDVEQLRGVAAGLSVPSTDWNASGVIRSEGGSGYYKMHKILRYDLRAARDYDIFVSVESHDDVSEFVVRIRCRNPM